jgi:hypothetical protein
MAFSKGRNEFVLSGMKCPIHKQGAQSNQVTTTVELFEFIGSALQTEIPRRLHG